MSRSQRAYTMGPVMLVAVNNNVLKHRAYRSYAARHAWLVHSCSAWIANMP